MWEKLGEMLKKAREASGLSVREIEKRSGVTFRTMYTYEHGNKGGIIMSKYVALCAVIGCDPAQLLAEAMTPEKEIK